MQHDDWLNYFADTAQRAGLVLSERQRSLFLAYMLELLEWNRKTNLTRIVEPQAIAVKHFLDSLLITRYIDIGQKKIADVGSGGGFPGIPLAILEPGCSVVLIESQRKKTSFLKHTVQTLGISNVAVYNGRAQSCPEPGSFDLATSRAFASLSDFIAIAAPLIKPKGSIVCMKGKLPQKEITALEDTENSGFEIEVHSYRLPEQGDARSLVVLRPCST